MMMPVSPWFLELLAKEHYRRGEWVEWLNVRLILRGLA
jgi:hypothetical protein